MDLEDMCKVSNEVSVDPNMDRIIALTKELFSAVEYAENIKTREGIKKGIQILTRKYRVSPSLSKILSSYRTLSSSGELKHDSQIEKMLRTKNVRSLSGVVVVTVFTSAYPETSEGVQEFSCKYDCHYCPKEPNQPRSYLLKEPGVLRANANKFISTEQFWDRSRAYIIMGHPLDKIELIVSGGTFSSYPREYLTNFFRDQFYAANVAYDRIAGRPIREALSLSEEQDLNQNQSLIKIIGITIETRPDCVNHSELRYFRQLGVTRVQIGVQHTDDRILDHINRQCKNKHTIRAIKMLKEAGFKVDIHLMPDLPPPPEITSDEMVELDRKMFYQVINDPEYQADQWKIYPCETVPWTEIEKWYKEGIYKPYAETLNPDGSNKLFELLIDVKTKVQPWVRLNRVIRDIPNEYIMGGNSNTSMRSDLLNIMDKRGLVCNCIRCREVKSQTIDIKNFDLKIRQYKASDGVEYFISWEDSKQTLLGFLRLRINSNVDGYNKAFPELTGCALIRELHVYGQVITHNDANSGDGVQHLGLGKGLINKAIEIAQTYDLNKISVISGVGVRNYYIKQGFYPATEYVDSDGIKYNAQGNYLTKDISSKLDNQTQKSNYMYLIGFLILVIVLFITWINV